MPDVFISPPNTQFVDPKTGRLTADAYRFLAQLNRQGGDSANASILTTDDEDASYPNSRRLAVTAPLTATDSGGGGTLTLDLADTLVVPGPYGSASKTVSFTVTRRGRIQVAAEYDLNTSNITEGSNQYFTNARARAAFSGSTNIDISAGGVISTIGDDAALISGPIVDLVAQDGVIQSVDQIAGFSGTGAYTNFTIDRGVITAAS